MTQYSELNKIKIERDQAARAIYEIEQYVRLKGEYYDDINAKEAALAFDYLLQHIKKMREKYNIDSWLK
jgi:hypothetical protein